MKKEQKTETMPRISAHIANAIELSELEAKLDCCVKELLADKQILARILKHTMAEFADEDISEIMKHMEEPVVSKIRLEPGHTNPERIQRLSEEDKVPGEGAIYYDIRFKVYLGTAPIQILINIEAQKSTNPSKLGYHLDNRIIFYLARMVSAQKEVEFSHTDYDGLKAVRSIWICMDSEDDEDSINRIRFMQETIYGKEMQLDNLDKVQGIIVRLRKNENAEISGNPLIAMLEELLKKEPADKKKQKLKETYGINMDKETERRLNTMCSLGERYYEQGIQQGIQRGQIQILADMIHDKLINVSEAAKRMGITEKEFLDRLQAENGSR